MSRAAAISHPVVRLAHCVGAQGDNVLLGRRGVSKLTAEESPALLVSFVYLKAFLRERSGMAYRSWALDSGAFSAYKSGVKIDLDRYTEEAKRLLAEDRTLDEVFALDVIGDARATVRNCERMWEDGVEAIPTYHAGSPEWALKEISDSYPKIALGGVAMADSRGKGEFARQCFARVWPKRIHGFGYGSRKQILEFPWHSVDATNWETGPCQYGNWREFGRVSVRGSSQNLKSEVLHYLETERLARVKWSSEMALLESA